MICPTTGFSRKACTCRECETVHDGAADLRRRKAHVMLAERDERERELLHLDIHLRDLVRELS